MKISLGSWAFSFGPYAADPVSFEDTVKHLSAAGYDGIDICGFPPHISLEAYPSAESRREVVRLLQDNNLGVSGYSADFSEVNPIAESNEAAYADLLKRNLQMSVDLGSPTLRVDTVAAPGSIPEDEYEQSFHRIARLWAEGAELAQTAGVRLVWEFEPGFAFNKPAEIVRMHQEVRHPNFSILFDTSHAYMCAVVGARQHGDRDVLGGGLPEFLDKLQGRIGAIHLIDSDGTLHLPVPKIFQHGKMRVVATPLEEEEKREAPLSPEEKAAIMKEIDRVRSRAGLRRRKLSPAEEEQRRETALAALRRERRADQHARF